MEQHPQYVTAAILILLFLGLLWLWFFSGRTRSSRRTKVTRTGEKIAAGSAVASEIILSEEDTVDHMEDPQ